MSGLISAASLYNHWKEISTFQEQFIWHFRWLLWNSLSCSLKYLCFFSDLRSLLRCRCLHCSYLFSPNESLPCASRAAYKFRLLFQTGLAQLGLRSHSPSTRFCMTTWTELDQISAANEVLCYFSFSALLYIQSLNTYSIRKGLMLKIKEAGDHLETADPGKKTDSGC